jgi:hypothetical protein
MHRDHDNGGGLPGARSPDGTTACIASVVTEGQVAEGSERMRSVPELVVGRCVLRLNSLRQGDPLPLPGQTSPFVLPIDASPQAPERRQTFEPEGSTGPTTTPVSKADHRSHASPQSGGDERRPSKHADTLSMRFLFWAASHWRETTSTIDADRRGASGTALLRREPS